VLVKGLDFTFAMASTYPASYEKATYDIDPEGDLYVRVYEYDYTVPKDGNGKRCIKKEGMMKVTRQVLMENSKPLRAMLDPNGPWAESKKNVVEIGEESVVAVELWFRALHDTLTEVSNCL